MTAWTLVHLIWFAAAPPDSLPSRFVSNGFQTRAACEQARVMALAWFEGRARHQKAICVEETET